MCGQEVSCKSNWWLSCIDVKNFNLGFVTENLDYYEILKKDFDEKTINTIMTEGLEGALAISSERKLASVWANIKTR